MLHCSIVIIIYFSVILFHLFLFCCTVWLRVVSPFQPNTEKPSNLLSTNINDDLDIWVCSTFSTVVHGRVLLLHTDAVVNGNYCCCVCCPFCDVMSHLLDQSWSTALKVPGTLDLVSLPRLSFRNSSSIRVENNRNKSRSCNNGHKLLYVLFLQWEWAIIVKKEGLKQLLLICSWGQTDLLWDLSWSLSGLYRRSQREQSSSDPAWPPIDCIGKYADLQRAFRAESDSAAQKTNKTEGVEGHATAGEVET